MIGGNALKRTVIGAVLLAGSLGLGLGSPPAAAVPAGTTTITMSVRGCEGCTIAPMTVRQREPGSRIIFRWTGDPGVVRNGVVRFSVPTKATPGMSFELIAPWERGASARPLIAMSDGIPWPDSSSEPIGEHCWAGTDAKTARIQVTVTRLTGTDGAVGRYRVPVAWASTASGPKGAIGHQDLPYCSVG